MKSLKAGYIVCLLILLLFINSAFADRMPIESNGFEGETVRTIPERMVHIINSLNTKIFFSLSYDGEDWREVGLDAMQSDVFEFANYIKISTKNDAGTEAKQYKLEQSRRYQIFWSAEEALYDVVKLSQD